MANIIILTLAVVGVTYGVRQSRIAKLGDCAPVFFVPEPSNSYDPLAIAVLNEAGEHLGYVGRNDPQREQIRAALAKGFVVARAMVVGGFTKRDGRVASLGLRVQWYSVDPMFNADAYSKDEEPDFSPLFRSEGKRRTDRYFLEKQHKVDDVRDIVSFKCEKVTDPTMRRYYGKKVRRAFKRGSDMKVGHLLWNYQFYLSDKETLEHFYSRRDTQDWMIFDALENA